MFRYMLAIMLAFAIGLTSSRTFAAEKLALRTNFTPGMSWTFTQNQEMSMSTSAKVAGQQQQMQQQGTEKMSGKVEVLAVADGKPTSLRVTFDPDCGGQMDSGPAGKQQAHSPLAGKTVTLKIAADGTCTHDAGQLGNSEEQELQAMGVGDSVYLPREPVAVGDSWQPDGNVLAKLWQVDINSSKFAMELTLKDVHDVRGRKVGTVSMTSNLDGTAQGMSVSRAMSGEATIDMQTGKVLSVNIGGKMSMSGMQQQKGPDGNVYVMDISSEGTVKSTGTVTLAGEISPPAPQPIPMPPAANAGGALTFADAKISLTFTTNPLAGGGSGKISMGDQQFPVKITAWDGTTLAGTFQSDGNDFEFSGQLNGDTLAFKTGGATYQLKSARAQPQNPLGR